MAELVVSVPEAHPRWAQRIVATALVVAALVVTLALLWPGTSKPVSGFDIPQRLVTQAEQETGSWEQLGSLLEGSQFTCRMGRPC